MSTDATQAPTNGDVQGKGGLESANHKRSQSVIVKASSMEHGEADRSAYKRGTVVLQVLEDEHGKLTKGEKAMESAKNKGFVSSSTVAEALVPGMNPHAVDAQCVAVLIRFRIKVFTLLVLQNIFVIVLALGFEQVIPSLTGGGIKLGLYLSLASWLVACTVLAILAAARHVVPWNYVLLAVFDVIGAFSMATLLTPLGRLVDEPDELKSPHLICFGAHTVGIVVLGVLSCGFFKGKTFKVFLVTPIAIMASSVVFVFVCMTMEAAPMFLVFIFVLVNALGLMWIGFHLDKLASMLTVDEYMQPIIVIWCEILIVVFLFLMVACFIFAAAACEDDSGGNSDCNCCAGSYCWLYGCSTSDDCFIHDDEKQRRQERHEEQMARRSLENLANASAAGEGSPADGAAVPVADAPVAQDMGSVRVVTEGRLSL